ncbi:MAG: hypothetical protein ACXWNQ_03555 [Anaerolineales bacterium]
MVEPGPDGSITRPDAPYSLRDPAEVAVWRMVVAAMPADYFRPTHFKLLIQYCRHSVAADRVAQLIETFCKKRKINCPEYASLLAMQNAESGAIIRLSRQLRLSPQAVYRAESAKLRQPSLAPWHREPWERKKADDD